MACTIVQADLGSLFADVDATLAADFIEIATEIVLGATASQATNEAAYLACGIDPCRQIKLLAQHLLTVTPGTEAGSSQTVKSERVRDVSVSYESAGSASGLWAGSSFGTLYAAQLSRFERCRNKRRSYPFGVGPIGAQP